MPIRKLRVGQAFATMLAGAAVIPNWNDPDTANGTAPVPIELEYAPQLVIAERITDLAIPANRGVFTVTATAQGATVVSSQALDNVVLRLTAYCRANDLGGV